jgi:hypothetical protein
LATLVYVKARDLWEHGIHGSEDVRGICTFKTGRSHRLSTDVLDDVIRLVDVYPVKVDTRKRARVRDAIEDWRHAAAGTTPVRPEIDDCNAVHVHL